MAGAGCYLSAPAGTVPPAPMGPARVPLAPNADGGDGAWAAAATYTCGIVVDPDGGEPNVPTRGLVLRLSYLGDAARVYLGGSWGAGAASARGASPRPPPLHRGAPTAPPAPDHTLVADHFYNGQPWDLGVGRWASEVPGLLPAFIPPGGLNFTLRILPLRRDSQVWLPPAARPASWGNETQLAALNFVQLWVYADVRIDVEG